MKRKCKEEAASGWGWLHCPSILDTGGQLLAAGTGPAASVCRSWALGYCKRTARSGAGSGRRAPKARLRGEVLPAPTCASVLLPSPWKADYIMPT